MSSFEATPTIESTVVISDSVYKPEGVLPWGRLYSQLNNLQSVDLVNTEFKFGRGLDCDIIITKKNFPVNNQSNISKCHFIITKDNNGPVFITDTSKNGTFINEILIGRGNKHVLQTDDKIATGFKQLKVFVFKNFQNKTCNYLPKNLLVRYEVDKILGQGACGEVRLVYEKCSCKQYAVKKIKKSSTSQIHQLNHPSKIKTEVEILQSIKHPCVIGLKETAETDEHYFIVMDYMKGGDLTGRILSINKMSEDTVRFYFYQILLAIRHLHKHGVMHRDIKSDNMLLLSEEDETLLKVSDFGLSKIIDEENYLKTICGTPSYVAPEVLNRITYKSYGPQADVWSLGVLLFYLLSSEMPFKGEDRDLLCKSILRGKYSTDGDSWQNVSATAKNLISKMLITNPQKRINIDDIFEHPWISNDFNLMDKVDKLLKPIDHQLTETNSLLSDSFEPPIKKKKK